MRYNPSSIEEAWSIIEEYDVISFDIWDTLITRNVLYPEDIFGFIGEKNSIDNFKQKRVEMVENSAISNPRLGEIYSQLAEKYGWNKAFTELVMFDEIATEKKVIRQRKTMVELYNRALNSGKKVYLISDMYLSADIMQEMLEQVGIRGFEKLYVSCDYRSLKQDNLFQIYKDDVKADKYLHIGDNAKADVESALANKLDVMYIKNTREIVKNSMYKKLIEGLGATWTEHVITGMFVAECFDNPFIELGNDGRVHIDDPQKVAKLLIAPLVSEYVRFLSQNCIRNAYQKILFSSRDGYLIQKLYKLFKLMSDKDISGKLPKDEYYYASRQLCTIATIQSGADIEWLASIPFDGTVAELLEKRFGIQILDRFVEGPQYLDFECKELNIQELTGYVMDFKDEILSNSGKIHDGYIKYSEAILKDANVIGFYDFVSSGTCQLYISKLIERSITGEYFCHSKTADERSRQKINSFYSNDGVEKAQSFFFDNYRFMELIMTSPDGSVAFMTPDGKPVFNKDLRKSEEIELVLQLQQNIEEYARNYYELVNGTDNIEEGKFVSDKIYQFFSGYFTDLKGTMWEEMKLVDDWTGNSMIVSLAGEDPVSAAIHDERDVDEILAENDNWDIFYHLSPMRQSVLNWYDFEDNAKVLHVNAGKGALTGTFCEHKLQIWVLTDNKVDADLIRYRYRNYGYLTVSDSEEDISPDQKFDYVVIEGVCAGDELKYGKYLADDGKILMLCDNASGSKYLCGYPKPKKEKLLTKSEIVNLLELNGYNDYKFYYPLPDYTLTQEIYTDNSIPTTSIRDRVLFYYPDSNMVNEDEYEIYEQAVEDGDFVDKVNSYLVEVGNCKENEKDLSNRPRCSFNKAEYVALSMDRAKERSFATIVKDVQVLKKPLYKCGEQTAVEAYNNIKTIESSGVKIVEHKLEGSLQIMPRIKADKAVDYIYKNAVNRERFEQLLDEFIECTRAVKGNKIYIDMVPLNAFVIHGEYVFFDQEFTMEESDFETDTMAKGYVIFRTLRYMYLSYPELEKVLSIDNLKWKYQLNDMWNTYLEIENEFIYKVRNHRVNHSFYNWIQNGIKCGQGPYLRNKVELSKGFDRYEEAGNDIWSWAIDKETEIFLSNKSKKKKTYEFRCEFVPPPGREKQAIKVRICKVREKRSANYEMTVPNGATEEVTAPGNYAYAVELEPGTEVILRLSICDELISPGNGDPRCFAFQLRNPEWG